MVRVDGFEPPTARSQSANSTAELNPEIGPSGWTRTSEAVRHAIYSRAVLPLTHRRVSQYRGRGSLETAAGIEPALSDPNSEVLPLNEAAMLSLLSLEGLEPRISNRTDDC